MRWLILFLVCISGNIARAQLLPSFGNSRTGTSGMQFLKIGADARSMGMAGAVCASPKDAASMFWNPGGITQIDSGSHYNLLISHTGYFAKTRLEQAAAVYKRKYRYWGLQCISFHSPEMKETTEFQPQGTGRTFTFADVLLGVNYSQVLTDNFSFGIGAKYVNESFANIHTNNILFDLGLFYNVHVRNTRFAAVVSNFGINVKPGGEVTALKFSGPTLSSDFSVYSAPSIFRLAIATDLIRTAYHALEINIQLNHPGDNNETFALGFEYAYNKILIARTGYEFGADEKGLPAAGVGIQLPRRFGGFRFDYAWQYKKIFGQVQRFGIVISLR
jgi:hypothetical protein